MIDKTPAEQKDANQTDAAFHLQHRFIRSYKKNTLAIFFSFALTITLITSLLILIHTNHRMENIQWQMLFTSSDCSINEINGKKVEKLTSSPLLDWYAISQVDYKEYSKNSQFILVDRGDDKYITLTTKLDKGRMPKAENEVVAERWALLNMGIEPICNQVFEVRNETDGKTEKYKLVGILTDAPSNKKFGVKRLYAPMKAKGDDNYSVYIRFKDGSKYKENVNNIKHSLNLKKKQIKECPGREDTDGLWQIDVKIISVLLLICMIVFYGVYRIALMSRKKLYGVLRAIGMKRGQMMRMILLELYEIYAISVPVGVILGVAIALLISKLSGDTNKDIYLNNEKISFSTVIPIWQIVTCILVIALFVGFVGYFSGRKIAKSQVPSLLSNSDSNGKHTLSSSFLRLGERYGRSFTLFSLGSKYILKDIRTSIFVILTICVGVTLFTGLSYKKEIAETYRDDTKEMNYLNGQYEMGNMWVSSALKGINRECAKKIETLKGVSSVKTQAGLPIRVVDDKNVKRNDAYYNDMNKELLKYHEYPIMGNDGIDQIYKSMLYGYNRNALKKLKKYVIAGDFDVSGLKEDEIILSVLHMDAHNEYAGNYKEGAPLMQYRVGDKIRMKYRADFDTNQEAYETLVDSKAKYRYKTYKVVAIVSFEYMFDSNRIVYPLLITNDEQVQKICPDSHIHRMNIDGDASLTKSQQEQLERQLIRLGNQSENVSTRSMISDIRNNEMLYQKQMVYVLGIAIVAFILVLINMINNLNYRMQTRTREICMYRAIGMSVKMIRRMMVFENGLLGSCGILLGYIISHPVLRYLYRQSEMKAFSHPFQFDYTDFFLISFITLFICIILSVRLSKDWKTKQIMERMGVVE